uniref:Deoxyribonuclease TATDN3 n=1 Tax=Steinernema glaseri TaxID=37863 RepID=A0A1I7ZEI8_9BILA
MIDCHCHLADPQFDNDIDDVILRAQNSGVRGAIVCAEFLDQFDRVLELSDKYPSFAFPAFGIHPVQRGNVSANNEHYDGAEEAIIREKHRLAAVGEVGLDFTPRYIKNDEDKAVQREIFAKQIAIARSLDLPLNVHSRSAGSPVIDFLIANGAEKVLLHAFSGNAKSAKKGIEAGFYFSIPPSFGLNKEEKKNLISAIPLEQLCLETDSPVLGPSKTERNEPMNIMHSAKLIAEVKNVSVDEVICKTTENALKLFPILKKWVK